MKARAIEALLWGAAVLMAAVAAVAAGGTRPTAESTQPLGWTAVTPEPQPFDAGALTEAAAAIAATDPFRLERQASRVPYGAQPTPPEMPHSPPPPPRPALSVSGIIGGPPWEAIIEGVPGRDGGVLVSVGQLLGELRIRAIHRDTVIVEGPDTMWILTLRRPWQ